MSTIYRGFDFHCHLDLYKDRVAALSDIDRAAILTLAVTTTPRAFEGNIARFGKSQYVRVGVGVHPELAETSEASIEKFAAIAAKSQIIGEIGLDARRQHRKSLPRQRALLEELLQSSNEFGPKLYSFHSPSAASEVLRAIEKNLDDANIKVLHWFSGTVSELDRAIEMGCYFSVNRAMLNTASGQNIVSRMPREFVLTETDGPFISTDRGPLLPSSVVELPNAISPLWRERAEDVHQVLMQNALVALGKVGIR